MIKRTVSLLLSLALLVNGVQPIHAADLVAIPQNVHLPTPPSYIQTRSSELSFKSIETKISNVLKPEKAQPKVAATYSGSCGTNVKWSLDTSTGKLTISGSGAMKNYSTGGTPWYSYKSYIKTVVIKNGVTSIGNNAFYDCTSLTTVTIPASVTSIGGSAFYYCSGLTSVTIPASVTSIGGSAFARTGLTSLTIPDSVTSISRGAFWYCSGLTSINVNTTNSNYKSINGVLFNKAGTTLISYPNGLSGSYTIPSSVTSIERCAFFYCTGLTSVTIPASVTSIGDSAFQDCSGLTSVTIGNGVTSIGNSAFSGCSGLTSVTIPDSVTSIGDSAFYGCSSLTMVTYEGTSDPGSTSINVFNNAQVTKVNVPYNYKTTTFCGVTVERAPDPCISTGTSGADVTYVRTIHLDRPFSFLRQLLNLFLLGKE